MSPAKQKKRWNAAESRRALLDAGRGLLEARGLAPGLDRVTLKDAIELSRIPRSSAYRLYEGGASQLAEFRSDLMRDLDDFSAGESMRPTLRQVLDDTAPLIESGDPIQMAKALRKVVQVTIHAALVPLANSLEWRVFMSSLVAVGTNPDPNVLAASTASADALNEPLVSFFEQITLVFGIRPRAPFTVQSLGVLTGSIIDGLALHQQVNPRLLEITRPAEGDDELETWTAAAIVVEALLIAWTEPNPAASATADLGTWAAHHEARK